MQYLVQSKTELFRRSYGNANYRPQQHWHYSCSPIRKTWHIAALNFCSTLASRWNSWMMMTWWWW